MVTERDLELQYLRDTGNLAVGNRGVYTTEFYNWCIEQLLTLKNTKDETKSEPKEYQLKENP